MHDKNLYKFRNGFPEKSKQLIKSELDGKVILEWILYIY